VREENTMPDWLIRNCYLDHGKMHLHRVAAKLETEPLVAGYRLRPRESRKVSHDYVERNHEMLEALVKSGVIEMTAPSGETVDAADMVADPATLDQVQAEVAPAPEPVLEQAAPAPEELPSVETPAPAAVQSEAASDQPKGRGRWKNRG
jgi:uncharacterized membrane protein